MARKFTKISAKAFESMQINAGVVLNKFDPSGTTEIQDADIICNSLAVPSRTTWRGL